MITLDSSYPVGGEALTVITNDFGYLVDMHLTLDPSSLNYRGYQIAYNRTTGKLQVFQPAPPIVHEELVTVTANVGYLKYPAAFVFYVSGATAGTSNVTCKPIAGGVTPTANMVAIDLGFNDTTGVLTKGQRTSLTFKSTDAVLTARVSYATQAWTELTDNMEMFKITSAGSNAATKVYGNSNMAADPIVDADVLRIGCDIVALQSVTWDDDGTIKAPDVLIAATAPAATNRIGVDCVKATTFAEILCHADTMLETATAGEDIIRGVYIKKPTTNSFISDRFTEEAVTASTDTMTFVHQLLLYGTCGQFPCTTAGKIQKLVATDDAEAAGEVRWTSFEGYPVPEAEAEDATDDNIIVPCIVGFPGEIATSLIEIPNCDLSNVKVFFTATGRTRN